MKFPEEYRWRKAKGYETNTGDPFGVFVIGTGDDVLKVIACNEHKGWEHVSVSVAGKQRTPTWEEMCLVKSLFWDEEETVVEFHPAKKDYVNTHPFVLHLWRNVKGFPTPPKEMV